MTADPYSSCDDDLASLAHGFRDDLIRVRLACHRWRWRYGGASALLIDSAPVSDEGKSTNCKVFLQDVEVFAPANVRDPEEVGAAERYLEQIWSTDLVVNNAGGQLLRRRPIFRRKVGP